MIVSSAASTWRSNSNPKITQSPAVIQHVVDQRDHGAGRVARREAEADVDEDRDPREDERVDAVAAQLRADLRADELDALDLERADLLIDEGSEGLERRLALLGRDLGLRFRGCGARPRAGSLRRSARLVELPAELDQELRVPCEPKRTTFGVLDAVLRHGGADPALVDRLLAAEADLHLGAAREVDART